jgi:hypothetical protein
MRLGAPDQPTYVPNHPTLANELVENRCWLSHFAACPHFSLEIHTDPPEVSDAA